MVDGGFTYLRGGAVNPGLVEDLCIVEEQGPSMEDGNDDWTTADLFEEQKESAA